MNNNLKHFLITGLVIGAFFVGLGITYLPKKTTRSFMYLIDPATGILTPAGYSEEFHYNTRPDSIITTLKKGGELPPPKPEPKQQSFKPQFKKTNG